MFFRPFFLHGYLSLPGDHLKKLLPWRYYFGYKSPTAPIKEELLENSSNGDMIRINYPHDELYNKMIKENRFPLWNPYNFCGHPLMAEGRTAMFYPPRILLNYFFNTGRAYTLLIIFNHILMGISMFYFLKELGISGKGAILGSLLWMYNGYITINLEYSTHIQTGVFFILNLLFIEKFFKKPHNLFIYFIMTLSMGITCLTGHLQYVFYAFILSFLYFSFRIIYSIVIREKKNYLKIILLFLLASFLSIMIGSVQVLPSLELAGEAVRPDPALDSHKYITLLNLAGIIYPCAVGDNTGNFYFSPEVSGVNNNMEANMFTGIASLHLVICAFLFPGWKKEKIFFSTLILLPLLILFKIPPFNLIFYLPVLSRINPFRFLIFYHLGISIIASLGIDNLVKQYDKKKIFILLSIMSSFFIINLIGISYGFSYVSNNVEYIITNYMQIHKVHREDIQFVIEKILDNYSINNPYFIIPILVWLFALLLLYLYSKYANKIILSLFVILAIGELFFYGYNIQPITEEKNLYFKTGFTDFLIENNHDGRVSMYDNYTSSLPPPNTLLPYSIMDVSGYASLYPGRFFNLMKAMENEYLVYIGPVIQKPKRYSRGLEQMLSIKYYMNVKEHEFPLMKKYPKDYKIVYSNENLEIIENRNYLPYFFSVGKYRVIEKEKDIIDFILSDFFHPSQEVVLEEKVKDMPENLSSTERKDIIKIKKYMPGDIELEIIPENKDPFFLVISDNYYPGWEAKVNGVSAPVYHGNYLFKALPIVPDSQNTIEVNLTFSPLSYRAGLVITLITFVSVCFCAFYYRRSLKCNHSVDSGE